MPEAAVVAFAYVTTYGLLVWYVVRIARRLRREASQLSRR
jgi:hypothetical protein